MKHAWAAGGLLALLLASCSSLQQKAPDLHRDPSAPLARRVDDLLGRMTLDEKVSQLMNNSPGIERLGVPAYNWWNECLHGVARAGRATVFPQAIGLAATWDTGLMSRTATAISDEARAKHHEFVRRGKRGIYQGLTFWTPNINLFRDPRWGRGMETYGEDPYLTSRMAVAFIKAMQGDDPKYLKTVATAKHYAVHSGPESLRHTFDAVIDDQLLRETYLPQFEAAVKEGGAWSVMCSYNRVDGKPACASPMLLDSILRKQWGFSGYVVSDCGAVGDIYQFHKYAATAPEGVAQAIRAGTDLDCGTEYVNAGESVRAGLITEADIDRSVRRLIEARFRLGMFDPPEMVRWAAIPLSEVDSAAHRELAWEAARKSIVLLKNDNHALPLSKGLKTIAVIGPNGADTNVLLGNYNGTPSAPVSLLEGIKRKLGSATTVLFAQGSDLAVNMPSFEVVPATALFTSDKPDRQPGLEAQYYASAEFDGKPHRPRGPSFGGASPANSPVPAAIAPLFTRVDPQVDFQWWDAAPRTDMNDDDFGVGWTGFISAPVSGTYQLGGSGLNAFELYFDGRPLVQFDTIHHHATYEYAPVTMKAGQLYPIRLVMHHYLNDAEMHLIWSRPGAIRAGDALAAARKADAVVLALGLSPRLEGEQMRVPVEGFKGGDRVQLGIPSIQEDLMRQVMALRKPTVLVLMNGSAVAVNWAREHVPAIVEAWYPGQAGGDAIADVLFGDYNPAGRLPVTFYKSAAQLPPFTDYTMKGKTYRYFEEQPMFPFGYGLSYTTFGYRDLRIAPGAAATGSQVSVSVEVENVGTVSGEEVVQLYLSPKAKVAGRPLRWLAGFQRVALKPGERRTVEYTLAPKQLARVNGDGTYRAEPGTFVVAVGGGQPGSGAPVIVGELKLTGEVKNLN
jgi:beta-glucosidase